MELTIISPEKVLYDGVASCVQVPGKRGRFEVLANHAPIISSMSEGKIVYRNDEEHTMDIKGGFIEVACNKITICIEV